MRRNAPFEIHDPWADVSAAEHQSTRCLITRQECAGSDLLPTIISADQALRLRFHRDRTGCDCLHRSSRPHASARALIPLCSLKHQHNNLETLGERGSGQSSSSLLQTRRTKCDRSADDAPAFDT